MNITTILISLAVTFIVCSCKPVVHEDPNDDTRKSVSHPIRVETLHGTLEGYKSYVYEEKTWSDGSFVTRSIQTFPSGYSFDDVNFKFTGSHTFKGAIVYIWRDGDHDSTSATVSERYRNCKDGIATVQLDNGFRIAAENPAGFPLGMRVDVWTWKFRNGFVEKAEIMGKP